VSVILDAVERLDDAAPGRPFTDEDIATELTTAGTVRKMASIRTLLARESQKDDGRVVRLANRTFVLRHGPGAGFLVPTFRTRAAAEGLRDAGRQPFAVADLLAQVNSAGAPLSQRTVYYAVGVLMAQGFLARPSWGRYAVVDLQVE
jgi:hypothetical protein